MDSVGLMEVTIDTKTLVRDLEKELTEYEEEYKEAITKYKVTLKEYYDYVDRVIKKGSINRIDMAPHPPVSRREQFEEHIAILNAHTKSFVVMDDHEYTEMLKGIETLKLSMRNESINYIDVATAYASKVIS